MLLSELQGGSPPCNSLQRNPLRTGIFQWKRFGAHTRIVGSPTSAIITISPGMASCTAAGRRTRSGHTPRAGTITVWVFATRADWMSEDFPRIPDVCPALYLLDLLRQLRRDYPSARILGHYQLSTNIRKACPCFDVGERISIILKTYCIVFHKM